MEFPQRTMMQFAWGWFDERGPHDSKCANPLLPFNVSDPAPLLLQVFSTFDSGGAQTRFIALANHFGRALRHVVVAMDGRYGAFGQLAPDIGAVKKNVSVAKGRVLTNIRTFRGVVDELRPDILITHNWGTTEWAMANWPRRVRHIHMEDGFGPDEAEGQLRRRVWARRLLLNKSTVVVPSLTLQRIARDVWRLSEKRVRYIPNGIDCARFAAAPDPILVRGWPETGPKIGTVAALRAEKNIKRLVRAFAQVAAELPCWLVIVGEGAERDPLERLVAELGLKERVLFAGHVVGTERIYGGFDIFALTSDTEQMPYTVLEAMAAGLPIATTEVGDVPHMVAPENLPYVVARNDAAVAGALRQLLGDAMVRRRVGGANQQMALATYDQSAMFAAYAALYGVAR
jgi:glycosyltransferase involved in cell wall biosynthesis